MTDTTALQSLADKVEAGDIRVLGPEAFSALNSGRGVYVDHQASDALHAYNGSLDAAMALHEALRPGQPFNVHFEQHADGHYCALFGSMPDDAPKWAFAPKWEAKPPMPSRSLLACEIRALIAKQPT